MLKIKMPKDLTNEVFEIFEQIKDDCKDFTKASITEDIQRALALVTDWSGFEIIKTEFTFTVSNCFSGYQINDDDAFSGYSFKKLYGDIWVTVYAFDPYVGFVRLGFNLFNFYQLSDLNREEIKNNMFVKVYKETK